MRRLINYEIYGIKLPYFLVLSSIVLVCLFTKTLGDDLLSTSAYLTVFGIITFYIGERIPIWNKWLGGGPMFTIMFTSWLVYMNIIPKEYVDSAKAFYRTTNWQDFYICLLIAGAILLIERKFLIKSFVRYIPTILSAIIGATILGSLIGLAFGIKFDELFTFYVLPIMGGGNNTGAVPLSKMYESVTGISQETYYSRALIILTVATSLCVIFAAILDGIGKKFTSLTGDGNRIMPGENITNSESSAVIEYKLDINNIGNSLMWIGSIYGVSLLFNKLILPSIAGVEIHEYVYFIIFLTLCNVFNIIPEKNKIDIKNFTKTVTGVMKYVTFACMGIVMTDFSEFLLALNLKNLIICSIIVIGACMGAAISGKIVGFYPIDSALTAGLCMADRGGGGDLTVLGAANRMSLMTYAAISSRIGGAIILIIGAIAFKLLY